MLFRSKFLKQPTHHNLEMQWGCGMSLEPGGHPASLSACRSIFPVRVASWWFRKHGSAGSGRNQQSPLKVCLSERMSHNSPFFAGCQTKKPDPTEEGTGDKARLGLLGSGEPQSPTSQVLQQPLVFCDCLPDQQSPCIISLQCIPRKPGVHGNR